MVAISVIAGLTAGQIVYWAIVGGAFNFTPVYWEVVGIACYAITLKVAKQ